MEKRNKIRDWELKRDDLNDKLDLCEETLRSQKQDPKPDDFKPSKERLAAAKVSLALVSVWTFEWFNLFNGNFGSDNGVSLP